MESTDESLVGYAVACLHNICTQKEAKDKLHEFSTLSILTPLLCQYDGEVLSNTLAIISKLAVGAKQAELLPLLSAVEPLVASSGQLFLDLTDNIGMRHLDSIVRILGAMSSCEHVQSQMAEDDQICHLITSVLETKFNHLQRSTKNSITWHTVGNAANCIGHLATQGKNAKVMQDETIVETIVLLLRKCDNKDPSFRNLGFAIANLAKNPDNLAKMRELDAFRMLAETMQ
eukprot:TRINITY_DN1264_c0_g2_i1.p1 TRINITY_DN1264_c0_g2~~TRINITY_DN1264_c0_g2_i1.p1  ORF type:complete len:231 (-),score=54.58 TRINITY_DN1264_c0_g2_i1:37-729(-)